MDLIIKNREKLELNGIKKIKSAEPTNVIAMLDNCSVIISGSNLTVQSVSIEKGTLELSGNVSGVKFSSGINEKKAGWKNIFK